MPNSEQELELLEQKILAGLRSGDSAEMTQKDWDAIRAEVRRRTSADASEGDERG